MTMLQEITIDDVLFELYTNDAGTASIRVSSDGNTVSVVKYPTIERAEAAYAELTRKAKLYQ